MQETEAKNLHAVIIAAFGNAQASLALLSLNAIIQGCPKKSSDSVHCT